jgi:hypothetical protein
MPGVMDKLQGYRLTRGQSAAYTGAKLVNNPRYNFTVDTDEVLLTEKGSYHSLSFPVYRDTANGYQENLVLHPYNGGYLSFLMQYRFNATQVSKIENGLSLSVEEIADAVVAQPLDETTGYTNQGPYFWDGQWWWVVNVWEQNGSVMWDMVVCGSCTGTPPSSPSPPSPTPVSSTPGSFTLDVRTWGPSGTGGGSTIFNPGGGTGGGTGGPNIPGQQPGIPYPDEDNDYGITNPGHSIDNGSPIIGYLHPTRAAIVAFIKGLTPAQAVFWNNPDNDDVVDQIEEYLNDNGNGNGGLATDAVEIAHDIINSSIDGTAISITPFFKYPPGSNYANLYPNLTEYLKNKMPLLKDNQFIIDKLVEYSELTEETIVQDLQWGKGPTIVISQLDDFGEEVYGLFQHSVPNTLFIDIDFVQLLEDSQPGPQGNSLAFLLGVTILHEYVHYGDNMDGIDQPGEEGLLFEEATYGEAIWLKNAGDMLVRWQNN